MEATPNSLPFFGMRFPKKIMRKNDKAGMTGIAHACSRNHPDLSTASVATSVASANIGSALHL
jgi:hypothetical protein